MSGSVRRARSRLGPTWARRGCCRGEDRLRRRGWRHRRPARGRPAVVRAGPSTPRPDLRGPCWSRLRLVGETDFSARESCGQGGQKSARLGRPNPRAGGRRGIDGVSGPEIPPIESLMRTEFLRLTAWPEVVFQGESALRQAYVSAPAPASAEPPSRQISAVQLAAPYSHWQVLQPSPAGKTVPKGCKPPPK